MKIKRIVGVLLAVAVACAGSAANAATWRYSRKYKVTLPSRAGANDIFYEDFINVTPGNLPAGVKTGSSASGYSTTGVTDIGNGYEKNCLMLVDNDHSNASAGVPDTTFQVGTLSGMVAMETRIKYETNGSSTYNSLVISQNTTTGSKMISRTVCASSNGKLNFNYGGQDSQELLSSKVTPGQWYTIQYLFDFDEKEIDVLFIDEANKGSKQILEASFYTDEAFQDLRNITFRTSLYGGIWYVDYIRVYKPEQRMEDYIPDVGNIKKGSAEPVKTASPVQVPLIGRTNIEIDGKIKYTTKAPVKDGENVLVTAKNVASFFNMAYYTEDGNEIFENDGIKFTVLGDGSGIKNGSKSMKLSAKCVKQGTQTFIPIADIAAALGYTASYDASADCLRITKSNDSEQEVK